MGAGCASRARSTVGASETARSSSPTISGKGPRPYPVNRTTGVVRPHSSSRR